MKNRIVFVMLVFGSFLVGMGSCSNEKGNSSNNDGLAMDSASVANRAKDELTLSILKKKKVAAEQDAKEAISNTREAKRIERDATDAAEQADDAFRSEENAQKSRQQADEQAKKAENASHKANEN